MHAKLEHTHTPHMLSQPPDVLCDQQIEFNPTLSTSCSYLIEASSSWPFIRSIFNPARASTEAPARRTLQFSSNVLWQAMLPRSRGLPRALDSERTFRALRERPF